ncbi:hypothetical protein AVEN_255364-1 [Araneus ventricosus]|uniref:CCHC-type domain-containing protein n=1 Tax=Araneus ventricosus TaxID=182803 RepID=A0A4Y2U5M6_ARAVE|nr:hypothetical protein AVEN_255364-1 [Araneus ventricosus]
MDSNIPHVLAVRGDPLDGWCTVGPRCINSAGILTIWCFKCQRFGHSKTNCRGTLTCARCAAAGHESTDCTAIEKCVNCDGKHTSFSRSCPKWKVEKEIVATKFKNNLSVPEARRLVKAQTPPDGKSYASVVDKSHPVYQTTNCPHCNHIVTMSNPVPSTSKSPEPVTIASSSGTKNKNILPKPSSQTSAVPQDSSAETANSNSESSEENSSDTDTDLTVTSAPEASNTQRKRARSKSEKSQKLKEAELGLTQKDLSAKLKKSAHHNSVALGLADRGIVHKDLPSIFGGVPQVPDLKLHPSDEDEDLQMNCDASETPPCVPTSNLPTLS